MIIKNWNYENVNPDGTFEIEDGAIKVDGEVSFSSVDGGCSIDACKCSEGHWICIPEPYDKENKSVSGVTISFNNESKLIQFIDNFIMKSKRKEE